MTTPPKLLTDAELKAIAEREAKATTVVTRIMAATGDDFEFYTHARADIPPTPRPHRRRSPRGERRRKD